MKKNRNGFTLIELLAVIIILGVLMLVAVPAVTGYISSSRRSSLASTASNFVKSVGVLVNKGEISVYDEKTLYLFPIGNDETKSCIKLESGGRSPFSDTYTYAYVGAVYNGTDYNYYLIGVDGARQGFDHQTGSGTNLKHSYILTSRELEDNGGDDVYAGVNVIDSLKNFYDGTKKDGTGTSATAANLVRHTYSATSTKVGSSAATNTVDDIWTKMNADGYIVSGKLSDGSVIEKVAIIGLNECQNK